MNTIMGDRIKDLRKAHQLTQSELADELNERFGLSINKSMISKWENGKGDPYLSYAKYLAFHFGVNLDYLVGLTDKKSYVFYFDDWGDKQAEKREFNNRQKKLNELFVELTPTGQEKAIDYIDVLVSSGKYSCKSHGLKDTTNVYQFGSSGAVSMVAESTMQYSAEPEAAHERTDVEVTDAMRKHDDDIMDSEDF